MPLRTRLLDMGELGAVRALALCRALAESAAEPAVLVARTVSPAVTVGRETDAAAAVDLALCAARAVPVVRLPGAGPATAIATGSLVTSLILPLAAATELGLPDSPDRLGGRLLDLLPAAEGLADGAPSRATTIETVGTAVVVTVRMAFDPDPRLVGVLIGGRGEVGGGGAGAQRSPAELAESLLAALERRVGLELVPSMPLPEELDGVWGWERRLAGTAGAAVEPAA